MRAFFADPVMFRRLRDAGVSKAVLIVISQRWFHSPFGGDEAMSAWQENWTRQPIGLRIFRST